MKGMPSSNRATRPPPGRSKRRRERAPAPAVDREAPALAESAAVEQGTKVVHLVAKKPKRKLPHWFRPGGGTKKRSLQARGAVFKKAD